MPTTNLNIPYLEPGQRDKDTAINDAFDIIDAAAGPRTPIIARDVTANLPDATTSDDYFAISTDDAPSSIQRLVISDGTNWVRFLNFDSTDTL